jgi:predicted kinase
MSTVSRSTPSAQRKRLLSPSTSTTAGGDVNSTLDFGRVSHAVSTIESGVTLCQRTVAYGVQFVHLGRTRAQMSRYDRDDMLIVMSGLPGVGKSAVADAIGRALPAAVISVDPIESAMRRSGIGADQPTGLAAYVVADSLTRHIVGLDQSVVVDAVNAVAPARDQWRAIAAEHEVPMRIIEVVCSDAETHRRRLAARTRAHLLDFPEPTWTDVQRTRDEFEPWTDERLVLDSMSDLSENIARALAYLTDAGAG